MRLLDDDASASALRHGRWQMVLFIAAAVVVLIAIVTHPELFQLEDGEQGDLSDLQAAMRPWSIVAVAAITVWALVFAALVVRHRGELAADAATRRSFRAASWSQIILPVLPGWLIWGPAGLPTAAIGLICLIATYVLARTPRSAGS